MAAIFRPIPFSPMFLGLFAHIHQHPVWHTENDVIMRRLDIRKIRKLGARERYGELYFYWREAEQMIASNFPQAQRYGRRLKKRVEGLYSEWFGPPSSTSSSSTSTLTTSARLY